MFQKIYIKIFLILFLLYQTPLHSKSVSFDNFNSKDLSKLDILIGNLFETIIVLLKSLI